MSAWSKLPRSMLGVLGVCRHCRGLTAGVLGIVGAGERQGSGKPTKTGSTPAVVPGAVSALVKAGVGGFCRVLAEAISILGEAARHMFRSRTCCDLIKFVILFI